MRYALGIGLLRPSADASVMVCTMQQPPPLTAAHALFLDFDGTLAELAPHPDAVQVAPGLVGQLGLLQQRLQGALAVVTGRPLADVDRFLHPLQLPAAFEHGAHYRWPDGSTHTSQPPDLAPVLLAAQQLAARHPPLLVEAKRASVALHYRAAPELEALCQAVMTQALEATQGLELMPGKCVLEVKAQGVDKGRAIADFMERAPYAGRIPVFAGDDVTDEKGFAAVQALGGWGIKVGEGATTAPYRCASPEAVRIWLQTLEG